MALSFDPHFESWLDQKLHQLRALGLQALGRKEDDEEEVDEVVLKEGRAEDIEDWDMDDAASVASEPEGRLPLKNSTHKGDYYQLMWNEGVDPTEGDPQGDRRMSARERVAQILRETELKTTKDPYAMTYIEDTGEDELYGDSGRYSYAEDSSEKGFGGRTEATETEVTTRHDVMENGYIQFGKIPTAARDEMFDSWDYDDELGLEDREFIGREAGDGQSDTNASRGGDPNHSPRRSDDLQIRFRKFKTDMDQIQTGEYIMDDEFKDVGPYPQDLSTIPPEPARRTQEQHILPMDSFGIASSSEDEAILDMSRDRDIMVDVTDTQPIVTVDQAQLTEQWAKRRRRMIIAVMTASVLIGVGAFVAIVYFVIHFLSG